VRGGPSQCFVLIKQSDSLRPRRFLVGRFVVVVLVNIFVCGDEKDTYWIIFIFIIIIIIIIILIDTYIYIGGMLFVPDPKSQSLSRSYGSVLPTSLTHIILVTRGCSPWRPAADISTGSKGIDIISPLDFQGLLHAHRTLPRKEVLFRSFDPFSR